MSKESKVSDNGINFTGLLLIAFIVLKLCNVIAWSWWWVLSPLWIPIILFIGLYCFVYHDKLRKIKKKRDELLNQLGAKSRWQQRMEEMQKRQQQS